MTLSQKTLAAVVQVEPQRDGRPRERHPRPAASLAGHLRIMRRRRGRTRGQNGTPLRRTANSLRPASVRANGGEILGEVPVMCSRYQARPAAFYLNLRRASR